MKSTAEAMAMAVSTFVVSVLGFLCYLILLALVFKDITGR